MPSRQQYVVVSVLALAALVGMVLSHGLQWAWATAGWYDPLPLQVRELPLTSLVGYGLAFLGAVFVLRYVKTRTLATEIVDELVRVNWPSRQETTHATMVVVVSVVIWSIYLGVFDAFWLWLTNWLLGVSASNLS